MLLIYVNLTVLPIKFLFLSALYKLFSKKEEINNMSTTSINADTNKQKIFLFSNNAFVDAGVQGGVGAIAGAGISLYNQHRTLKNPEKLQVKINKLEEVLVQLSKCEQSNRMNKKIKNLQGDITLLKEGKYNLGSMKNIAILVGVVTFVPTLIGNLVFLGGKKTYDKIANK